MHRRNLFNDLERYIRYYYFNAALIKAILQVLTRIRLRKQLVNMLVMTRNWTTLNANKTSSALRNVWGKNWREGRSNPWRFSRLLYRDEKLELKIFDLIPFKISLKIENEFQGPAYTCIKPHNFVFTLLSTNDLSVWWRIALEEGEKGLKYETW